MDLTKLREAIGAAKEITDEQVIEKATAKLTEAVPALELSRTQASTIQTITAERDTARTELSRLQLKPEPAVLSGNASTAAGRLQLCQERGQCTPPQAEIVKELIKADGPQAALMLSRSPYEAESTLDKVFKLLELNKTLNGFQQTQAQPVARQTPGADGGVDLLAEGRNEGAEWQKRQQQSRGMATA